MFASVHGALCTQTVILSKDKSVPTMHEHHFAFEQLIDKFWFMTSGLLFAYGPHTVRESYSHLQTFSLRTVHERFGLQMCTSFKLLDSTDSKEDVKF